jgi:hypothetical protein
MSIIDLVAEMASYGVAEQAIRNLLSQADIVNNKRSFIVG